MPPLSYVEAMADYYPILTRAVGGLDSNTGEARRAVYDRARTALVAQLRGFDPPLADADIKRERLALEESIRRVENETRALEGEVQAALAQRAAEPPAPERRPPPMRGPAGAPPPAEPAAVARQFSARDEFDDAEPFDADAERGGRRGRRRVKKQTEQDGHGADARSGGSRRLPLLLGGALALLLILGGLGYYLMGDRLIGGRSAASLPASSASNGKIADRVQQGGDTAEPPAAAPAPSASGTTTAATGPAAASSPGSPVIATQRAILYEENGDPQGGATFNGTAVWRIESSSPGQGQPPETALRGDINIPDRFSVVLLLRRNTDSTLPASHTIEIQFKLPANFPNAGIANVPGLIMKTEEQAQGAALAGLSVRVTGGVFLIGLSNLESERGANEQLLRDRAWIDIPILYDNGRRAVLTLEKGTPGIKAFADALVAWHNATDASAGAGAPSGGPGTTTPQ